MRFKRSSGILLHLSSLPGGYGIGDFGKEAYKFIDLLKESGHSLWQIFPLGPTGYGDSPYQCLSAFAGNPLFISPDLLAEDKLLDENDIDKHAGFSPSYTDYDKARSFKIPLLTKAFANFVERGYASSEEYICFCETNKYWLDNYSLFIALKKYNGYKAWFQWERDISLYDPGVLARRKEELKDKIEYENFLQFIFHKQWFALKGYANKAGVKIIGDMPIYVAYDSADVWSEKKYFSLNDDGSIKFAAGVPPDYFSPTGQLWGNPTYNWSEMEKDNFEWWKKRFSKTFSLVDIVRIDHFRGFDEYWGVDGKADTAQYGDWLKAPGEALFSEIHKAFWHVPIIAEDLGLITKSVEELRDKFDFPGIKIVQFGLGKHGARQFQPHNFINNCVVHTGSHDNDTTRGFLENEKHNKTGVMEWTMKYFNCRHEHDLVPEIIRTLYASTADTVIIPLQDIMDLGTEARMNLPGSVGNNWKWRFQWKQINKDLIPVYREMNEIYERKNDEAVIPPVDQVDG